MSITPEQCRAARALLNISQNDLAEWARVSRATLADFERGIRTPHPNNLAALRRMLEDAGIIFIAENGDGPGVRLKKNPARQRVRDLFPALLAETDSLSHGQIMQLAQEIVANAVMQAESENPPDLWARVDELIAAVDLSKRVLR